MNSEPSNPQPNVLYWLIGTAAAFIVLAGLRTVSHIVTPFLLAAFLAIISAPLMTAMQKRGVPSVISILLLFVLVGVAFFLLFLALQGAAESLAVQAPQYQAKLSGWWESIQTMLTARGVPTELIPQHIPLPEASAVTNLATTIAAGLGQFTATTLLVLLAFMFLLLEEQTLSDKLTAAFPNRRRARVRSRRFLRSVYRYLLIKTGASTLTGLLVGIGLSLMGIDFAILWGIVAGLLNFIPTIGSFIAAIPALLVAIVSTDILHILMVIGLYLVVNVSIGSIMEPRLLGRSLGLSPVVVLISLLVWGWVFGPVGMLLAVPLTMIAKLALDSNPKTRWAGILLSDQVRQPAVRLPNSEPPASSP
ncbi:AI-2E family transporter [Halothiobacillus diazotrophicus]|uniref:AI-2E family transporter n=1 Tax=Halothiobacillus diazotrophicus TaxID=1860122 RepID=A0A191ZG29_9GAMM|nr:AI-2E family transporter [Halothiobacillus diazotrophicus]ANJ66810.1 AI-2E family transporter [Halothiobacillus diazotrophicus]